MSFVVTAVSPNTGMLYQELEGLKMKAIETEDTVKKIELLNEAKVVIEKIKNIYK